MINYRDMTFCENWEDCKDGQTCFRSLTPEVLKAADKWWGKGKDEAPIAIFYGPPDCHTKVE